MLCPGGDGFIDQVKGYTDLPTEKEFFSPGISKKVVYIVHTCSFKVF
jgi:hypothetical protein